MPPCISRAADRSSIELTDVVFRRADRTILGPISFRVDPGQHWVVLGPNGAGKSVLLQIAALYEHPTSGAVRVLGETLGHTDIRRLRRRIGYAAAALADRFRVDLSARDIVMTARFAALEPWWDTYTPADRGQAEACLARLGVAHLADRSFGTLSSGEQQRVLLARTLMNDPSVVLLDEPSARLDLGGREQLVRALEDMMTPGPPVRPSEAPSVAPPVAPSVVPSVVMVSHHVTEIPTTITHALLLRAGTPVSVGPIAESLNGDTLSECFGLPLTLDRRADGRLSAWARA